MTHDELLTAFGERYGLPDCRLDASGQTVFDLGDGVLVYVESLAEENTLLLRAAAAVVADPDPRLLTVLLGSNYFYRGANTAIAAYNIATREVAIVMGLETAAMGPEDLAACLDAILDDVEYWRSVVNDGDQAWDMLPPESVDPAQLNFMGMA